MNFSVIPMDIFTVQKWMSANLGWLLTLLIQGFIAYHIYFLSKRLSNKGKLEHKDEIKIKAEAHLYNIRKEKLNSDVYLVNINRYFNDYPSNKEKRFGGYSHLKAEIKSTRFDGIEFFSGMIREVYQKIDGKLYFDGLAKEKAFNVYPVGIVPYEWIEYIDFQGDEFGGIPLFYCYFKGKTNWRFWRKLLFYGFPYKKTVYYKQRENYNEHDPYDIKYEMITEKIK